MNGGYILLDLTPYDDGDTSLELRNKLTEILNSGKLLIVLYNTSYNQVTPVVASLVNNADDYNLVFRLYDEVYEMQVDSDGVISIQAL